MIRVRVSEALLIECDEPAEAVEVARLLGREATPRKEPQPPPAELRAQAANSMRKLPAHHGATTAKKVAPPPPARVGRYEESRLRAMAWLQEHGPAIRSEVCRRCAIKMGSMTPVFNDPRFTLTDDGKLWLAGVAPPEAPEPASDDDDEPFADDPLPEDDDDDAEIVDEPESPPPPRSSGFTPSSVARAVDVVAAELAISEPLSLFNLGKRLKFDVDFLAEVLANSRFASTPQGYRLAHA